MTRTPSPATHEDPMSSTVTTAHTAGTGSTVITNIAGLVTNSPPSDGGPPLE
ncbi:hypothetical protein SAV14893_028200 [Streptomyces avermitilis]|uniref:Uncharacterized protein n=1 Tax=Streptomyces avermitilis TaxID=33903 RepID=A0A4D4LYJ1_STRAX|nr:hypothetical protein SAVMC3_40120 [Streptomyces avermitilis]GDY63427.1 hypothetical protein SAV14893_028200 [Streptomyces avermitilis]GDY76429.1 hypothetical protein SAV31267_059140 [Streptomyces avermitilis]